MLAKGLCPLQDLPTLLQSRAYIVGKSLVYFGRMHATLEYAQLLAPVLGALAGRALAGG